jgi:hypothetical protein
MCVLFFLWCKFDIVIRDGLNFKCSPYVAFTFVMVFESSQCVLPIPYIHIHDCFIFTCTLHVTLSFVRVFETCQLCFWFVF